MTLVESVHRETMSPMPRTACASCGRHQQEPIAPPPSVRGHVMTTVSSIAHEGAYRERYVHPADGTRSSGCTSPRLPSVGGDRQRARIEHEGVLHPARDLFAQHDLTTLLLRALGRLQQGRARGDGHP